MDGVNANFYSVTREIKETIEILNELEIGKEYYLAVGKHAAIVKRTEQQLEYLELQSAYDNGWHSLDVSVLKKRFGARKAPRKVLGTSVKSSVELVDVDEFKNCDEFKEMLGYINTNTDKQKKGGVGYAK